ncbi:MAG TPA: hypothetical protein VGN14_17590 [Candidatus Elarobacter sp.]
MSNRRIYPRRRVTFPATYTTDGENVQPAYGLDFGGGGVQLLTREPLSAASRGAIELTVMLNGRRVRVKATRAWTSAFISPEGTRYRHGMRLKTITDRDWEYLMELLVEDAQIAPGTILTPGLRDSLLSAEKQHRIAEALAAAGRLTYHAGRRLPLIEYAFDGYTMRMGTRYYALRVRSRVTDGSTTNEYRTQVLVEIEAEGVRILG